MGSYVMIILVDGESVAPGYVTPSSLENVPEEKLCWYVKAKGEAW